MDSVDQDITSRERRDQYLAAIGIQVWAPRGRSEAGQAPADATQAPDRLNGAAEPPVAAHSRVNVEKATPGELASPAAAEAAQAIGSEGTRTPRQEAIQDRGTVPRFCLNGVYITDEVLVVCDVPLDSGDAQPLAHQVLLLGILAAMGYRVPELSSAKCFHWPMLQPNQFDQGETVAREAIGTYLAALLAGRQPKILLLLGEVACRYLAPGEENSAIPEIASQCPAIRCPGLGAMLENPGLKASTWHSICEYLGEQAQSGRS